jgi:hypothetical protein
MAASLRARRWRRRLSRAAATYGGRVDLIKQKRAQVLHGYRATVMNSEKHRERLGAFVVRARRVLASPLAQDDAQLGRAHEMQLVERSDRSYLRVWLPDEHELESLAARARPLLLTGDTVYYANALASLSALVPATKVETRALRSEWSKLTNGAAGRYAVQGFNPDQPEPPRTWDNQELANAFLYGDLVHADAHHQGAAAAANLNERYRAAFGLLADLVALLWRTLGLVWLYRRSLDLPDWAWSTEVSIEGNRWLDREGTFYTAPLGTKMPASLDWPDGWIRLGLESVHAQCDAHLPTSDET